MYSDIVQIPGDWSLAAKRGKQRNRVQGRMHSGHDSTNRTTTPTVAPRQSPVTQPKRTLKGCRPEELITVYLEHIQKGDNDTNEDITQTVRTHGRSKGVRVVSAYTVRNRFCQDVVGCKIVVPVAQALKVMAPGFWAEEITCREWEREPPRKGRSKRGQRAQQPRRNQATHDSDDRWEARLRDLQGRDDYTNMGWRDNKYADHTDGPISGGCLVKNSSRKDMKRI
jgi:hypothetical protein